MSDAFLVISGLALLSVGLGVVHTLLIGYLFSNDLTRSAAQNGRYALLGHDTPSSNGSSGHSIPAHFSGTEFSPA